MLFEAKKNKFFVTDMCSKSKQQQQKWFIFYDKVNGDTIYKKGWPYCWRNTLCIKVKHRKRNQENQYVDIKEINCKDRQHRERKPS